jgi:c-di-GMP-binding flagellar brake protein YcgR
MSHLIFALQIPLPLNQSGFYFRNWEYDMGDFSMPLLIIVGLVALLVLASVGQHLYRRYKRVQDDGFTIHNARQIQKIFTQALDERATFDTQFQGEWSQRPHFSCAPLDLDVQTGLTLEIPAFVQARQSWIGREVICYFKIAAGRRDAKWNFFHFTSRLIAARPRGKVGTISLALPEILHRGQRRAHLRLEPLSQDIPEIHLWPETLSNQNVPEEAPPLLSLTPDMQERHLFLINISAGGLLLEVRAPTHLIDEETLEKGKRFHIHLLLHDPDRQRLEPYRLLAQVRNMHTDPVTAHRLVGLAFVALQTQSGEDKGSKWVRLEGKGVESIEDWVFKRHLRLYRQKGLA